jgi:hypothetical protein
MGTLYTTQIPLEIQRFNRFLGHEKIASLAERVSQRVEQLGVFSPLAQRRFLFHTVFPRVVRRLKLGLKPDLSDIDTYDCLSFVASVNDVCDQLSGDLSSVFVLPSWAIFNPTETGVTSRTS